MLAPDLAARGARRHAPVVAATNELTWFVLALLGSVVVYRTLAISCGMSWRDACASTRRDDTDRQLHRVVRRRIDDASNVRQERRYHKNTILFLGRACSKSWTKRFKRCEHQPTAANTTAVANRYRSPFARDRKMRPVFIALSSLSSGRRKYGPRVPALSVDAYSAERYIWLCRT